MSEHSRRITRVGFIALASFALAAPTAAMSDCSDAVESYNSAMSEVEYGLKRYSRCVGSSQGGDDCSSEFRGLKSAHDDFESAVSSYGNDC